MLVLDVWAKGDKCLAPYSEDGEDEEFHEARIEKIMKIHGSSQTVAVVVFVGYEDDGQEAFDISKLRKPEEKEKSMHYSLPNDLFCYHQVAIVLMKFIHKRKKNDCLVYYSVQRLQNLN